MAVLKNGILGPCSGAVGPVVGSSWKGRGVLRARPDSFDPATSAQLSHRSLIQNIAVLAACFNTRLQPYDLTRLYPLRNLFNYFVKSNFPYFTSNPATWQADKFSLAPGSLFTPGISHVTTYVPSSRIRVYFPSTLYGDALSSDYIWVYCYNVTTGAYCTRISPGTRSGTYGATYLPFAVGNVLYCWAFFTNSPAAGLVTRASPTSFIQVTVS